MAAILAQSPAAVCAFAHELYARANARERAQVDIFSA
jgi:hypothetical protein